jgi:hypothetical protein
MNIWRFQDYHDSGNLKAFCRLQAALFSKIMSSKERLVLPGRFLTDLILFIMPSFSFFFTFLIEF